MAPLKTTLGCVSFLNAKPLVEGLDTQPHLDLRYDVPSRLLDQLLADQVDVALCPVIDYQTAQTPLVAIPAGGIGCDGPTMTVRLYSQIPLKEIRRVHTDTDSHTSVALLQVILHDAHGVEAEVCQLKPEDQPTSMLLIGDKVVTAAPNKAQYPYDIDLGQAWKELTGLPFVFAIWMAKPQTPLGTLPEILLEARKRGTANIGPIVERFAPALGWPKPLATTYLGQLLQFETGPRQLQAIETFWQRAAALNLCANRRPLQLAQPHQAC